VRSVLQDLRPTLLLLTFATGVIDAVSYLAVGGVFTANMTGNLVLVGFALAGTTGFSVARTLVSLLAFVAGATLAGQLARRWHPRPFRWMQRVTWGLLPLMLGAGALIATLPSDIGEGDGRRLAIVAILALAMGMLNATVRRLGFRDIPTTVATSTISDLASESRFGGGEQRNQRDRMAAIGCMGLGALAGALLVLEISGVAAFSLAIVATMLAAGHQTWVASRRDAG
jgi:uncharacterized membrane protein YoaK (UPF0700 family)